MGNTKKLRLSNLLNKNGDPSIQLQRLSGHHKSLQVNAGNYIRAHIRPKRFPEVYQIQDWTRLVVYDQENLMVVNKPKGVPCTSTVDNVIECLPYQMSKALGYQNPLHVTSRLDQGTEGLVILSKGQQYTKLFQQRSEKAASDLRQMLAIALTSLDDLPEVTPIASLINFETKRSSQEQSDIIKQAYHKEAEAKQQQLAKFKQQPKNDFDCKKRMQRQDCHVEKLYRALSQQRLQTGLYKHYAITNYRQAQSPEYTFITNEKQQGSKICLLEIKEVSMVKLNKIGQEVLKESCGYEHTVKLITGRTHQIRAQFAQLGAPLLGDKLYNYVYYQNRQLKLLDPYKQYDKDQVTCLNEGDNSCYQTSEKIVNQQNSDTQQQIPNQYCYKNKSSIVVDEITSVSQVSKQGHINNLGMQQGREDQGSSPQGQGDKGSSPQGGGDKCSSPQGGDLSQPFGLQAFGLKLEGFEDLLKQSSFQIEFPWWRCSQS